MPFALTVGKHNTMKKLWIALVFASGMCAAANAQNSFKSNPGGFYLKGGVNFANISVSSNGSVNNANTLTTFNVGFIGDIPLASMLSLQTGLYLNSKGAKTESYFDDNDHTHDFDKLKFNPLYIELPASLVLKFPMDESSRFFAGAGPYVAMGVGGKVKGTQNFGGVTTVYEQNIKFNDDDPTTPGQEDAGVTKLRRFDYGVNFLAGFEFQRYMLGLNYGLGLAKIGSAQDNNNDKNKYRVFSINVGVRF